MSLHKIFRMYKSVTVRSVAKMSSNIVEPFKPQMDEFQNNNSTVSFPTGIKNNSDVEIFETARTSELSNIAKNLLPTYNFASYVNQSPTLQELVKLGVDLSKLERKPKLAEYVLMLNFEKDVKPYIRYFVDLGVSTDDLGPLLTKNIALLKEPFDDLDVRINYLQSKKFDKNMIVAIISRNPFWLTTPVGVIDARLGWLQSTFKLKGDDVRQIVNLLPQIVTYDINFIKLNMFVLEEEMGLSKGLVKKMLLTRPRLFTKSQQKLLKSFEFVHNSMKVPVELIVAQPDILMERVQTIKERHLFLESLGRAQYNPLLPGYISLDALIKSDEVHFCSEIAKSSMQSFDLFLKTL